MILKHKFKFAILWIYAWILGVRVGREYRHYVPELGFAVRCVVNSITGDSVTRKNLAFMVQIHFYQPVTYQHDCKDGAYTLKQVLHEFDPIDYVHE